MDEKWCLTEFRICISMTVNDIEHLFMFFLAICIHPSENCLFESFVLSFFFIVLKSYLFGRQSDSARDGQINEGWSERWI